jgi:hypothetical protein
MTTTINSLNSTTSELQVNGNPALRFDDTAKTIRAVAPYNLVGNGPAFSVYLNAAQLLGGTGSLNQINFNAEVFDTHNAFASNVFTAPVAGYYSFSAGTYVSALATNLQISLEKNAVAQVSSLNASNTSAQVACNAMLLAVNDVVRVTLSYSDAPAKNANGFQSQTYFHGCMVRAA